MRINVYLNKDNDKDKIIIDYLNSKYNCQAYIKEMLYALATETKTIDPKPIIENVEVFEEIKGIECIDI